MAINSACGPHCGIRANAEDTISREAHCPCDELCHAGDPPPGGVIRQNGQETQPAAPRGLDGSPLTGVPMCTRWYELAGGYRPWQPPHTVIRDDRSTPVPDATPWA